jgi:hypothetical protein
LGGTLVNVVKVDGVELANVNVCIQNSRHVSAWIMSTWAKVFFQVNSYHLQLLPRLNGSPSPPVA